MKAGKPAREVGMDIRLSKSVPALIGAGIIFASLQAGPALADDGFKPRPQGGISGALLPNERKLWKYDFDAGKYVEAAGDASGQYVPNLRKPAKPLTFAFAEGWAAIPFSVSINKGIYRIAGDLGIKIIYCDQEFKPEKAVTCAEQLSQQKPDFAIVSNWQSGAAEAVMKIYNAAKIPVVNIDVWHPNGIFFGADNYISGEIGGKAAGEFAKSLGKCADVTIPTASIPAKAMPPTSVSPASPTASRKSAAPSPPTESSRRSSTLAPPSRRSPRPPTG
jgi:ribose transport system substrate-binding protein